MTFEEKLRNNYYSTIRTNYPDRKDFTRYYVYQKGVTLVCGDKYDVMDALNMDWECIKSDYIIEEVCDEEEYTRQHKAYYEEVNEKEKEFNRDAMHSLDYDKLPKSIQNKIYAYAWNHGSGYHDIYNELLDLSEIVDEIINVYRFNVNDIDTVYGE